MVGLVFASAVYTLSRRLNDHHIFSPRHAGIIGWAESTGLKVLILLAAILILVLLVMIVLRLVMRGVRANRMKFSEIILGPDDESTPFEVMSALDSIHGTLLARSARTMAGQNYFTFEIMRSGDGRVRFVLGAPSDWLHTVEDILRSKYTTFGSRSARSPDATIGRSLSTSPWASTGGTAPRP